MENKIDARCCLQIGIKFYVQFMVCGELEMKLSMMAILEQKKGSPDLASQAGESTSYLAGLCGLSRNHQRLLTQREECYKLAS
jgi:hypothetical protein